MFLASRITSASISAARSTAAVSVEKKGLPVPQPKMHHPALFQMPDGSGADVGLRHRTHLDGRLDPDVHALLLQHVRQGQGS